MTPIERSLEFGCASAALPGAARWLAYLIGRGVCAGRTGSLGPRRSTPRGSAIPAPCIPVRMPFTSRASDRASQLTALPRVQRDNIAISSRTVFSSEIPPYRSECRGDASSRGFQLRPVTYLRSGKETVFVASASQPEGCWNQVFPLRRALHLRDRDTNVHSTMARESLPR